MTTGFFEKCLHLFTPQPSNNHRAKILHPSMLTFIITGLLIFQVGMSVVGRFEPQVLGYASNISVAELLADTNNKRLANGAGPLTINAQLTAAAASKGADMFEHQYWAHVSPQGKDPWSWIIAAGYNYVFAGENLARDFGDSHGVVDAWMNSPSHRENLLNSRFKDVGFAVINGKFGSSETTLVVQEFGTKSESPATVEAPPVVPAEIVATPSADLEATPEATPVNQNSEIPPQQSGSVLNIKPQENKNPRIDILSMSKVVSTALLAILISTLVIDGIYVYRKKIVRLSGHNFAHLVLLLAILAALNVIGRGLIL